MTTDTIIKYCSPTLAGLKVANLFSYGYETLDELFNSIKKLNAQLNKKGVYFSVLKVSKNRALILVYRENKLQSILENIDIQIFLQEYNYTSFNCEDCFTVLKQHLKNDNFPHEIGIFLGYPLEDTKAFIKHKGKNYLMMGYWKVYSNIAETNKLFEKFNKAKRIYAQLFAKGFDISRLTVAEYV